MRTRSNQGGLEYGDEKFAYREKEIMIREKIFCFVIAQYRYKSLHLGIALPALKDRNKFKSKKIKLLNLIHENNYSKILLLILLITPF